MYLLQRFLQVNLQKQKNRLEEGGRKDFTMFKPKYLSYFPD